jgi:pimeloyl-ACP methyl ester carboxylesterase/ketosteroid isomerase-like protein
MVMTGAHPNATTGPNPSIPDPYVLLHGAWHDGRSWADVKAALEARGHRVHTPTLAGHGPDADRVVTRDEYVSSVTNYIRDHELSHVTLVAHSMAGLVAPGVVEALPERIARVIFLDAIIPISDQNAFFGIPPEVNPPLVPGEDGTVSLGLETWLERFWRDEGADPILASDARGEEVWRTLLTPEPLGPALEPIPLPRFAQILRAGLPTTYIRCRQDHVFGDPAFWQRMVDRLPGCQVIELAGSHEVLFTRPRALADALLQAVHREASPFPPEARLALMQRFYAAVQTGDLDEMLALVHPGFIEHHQEAERGGPAIGHEVFRRARRSTCERLTDIRVIIRSAQPVEPDALFLAVEIQATSRETAAPVVLHATSLVRFRDGLIAEHWEHQVPLAALPVAAA